MFSSKPGKVQNRIDSLIGAGTRVEGNITFTGGLRIDGEVLGNVTAAGDEPTALVISEHARVEGEIHVSRIVVNGTIIGPVFASQFAELQPNSRVTGDLHYASIEIHLGSVVQGRLVHQGSAAKAVELKLASSN